MPLAPRPLSPRERALFQKAEEALAEMRHRLQSMKTADLLERCKLWDGLRTWSGFLLDDSKKLRDLGRDMRAPVGSGGPSIIPPPMEGSA